MKTKIPIFIIFLALLIAGVNIWLWYSPSVETNDEQGLISVSKKQQADVENAAAEVVLSEDAEYPAPVIQLQRALAQGLRDEDLSQMSAENHADFSPPTEVGESTEEIKKLKNRLAELQQLVGAD